MPYGKESMPGKRIGLPRFTIRFNIVMSVEMKQALRERAKRDNIPEVQVLRQLLADEFDMSEDHVNGSLPQSFQGHSPIAQHPSAKRIFHDVTHPLEAAWGRPVIKEEDKNE